MASIFKRRKGKNQRYTIQYVDHGGKRKTVQGFTDKGLTEQLAGKLETEARLRKTGLVDTEQERLMLTKRSPLEDHLKTFEESLSDNTPKYIRQTVNEVRCVAKGAGFESLGAIEPEAVQAFLRSLRRTANFGHRTYNHYLDSLDTFCHWCVATKRLLSNPLAGIERLNTALDVRHPRRALTADEVSKLIQSARSSGVRIERYSGEQRARIYLLSYLTGLRKKELGSLTPRSFNLESTPPRLTVEAAYSKHRRKDVLPLHPELVTLLPKWLAGLAPGEKLFPKLENRHAWLMVKRDLERVGIAYQTADGIADFHAAGRHTHITELLRNGASLPEAKELARHSDIKTTMRYTHIGIKDQAQALAGLVVVKSPETIPSCVDRTNPDALHGRCISGGAQGQSVSPNGSELAEQNRQNPCDDKGFGKGCHRLPIAGNPGSSVLEPAAFALRWISFCRLALHGHIIPDCGQPEQVILIAPRGRLESGRPLLEPSGCARERLQSGNGREFKQRRSTRGGAKALPPPIRHADAIGSDAGDSV